MHIPFIGMCREWVHILIVSYFLFVDLKINFYYFIENTNKTNSNADDLDLTGIDDNEIESVSDFDFWLHTNLILIYLKKKMLLSKDEIKTKAKLWLRANKDWLKEQKMREDQRKKDKEEMKTVEPKQKKTVIVYYI